MSGEDFELERLRRAERAALARLERVSQPGAFPAHDVAAVAEDIWREAAAAVLAHQKAQTKSG